MNKYLVLYICFSFIIYIHKVHFLGIKHRETSPNWTLFSKNFISEFTYIKCIIQKISKKRVSVTLCATLVPHLWHMWHKYKCATLLWHKFYKLHLFHFSTYRNLDDTQNTLVFLILH